MTTSSTLAAHLDRAIPKRGGTVFLILSISMLIGSLLAVLASFVWIIGSAILQSGSRGGAAQLGGELSVLGWTVGSSFILSLLAVALAICIKVGASRGKNYRQAYIWFGYSALAIVLAPVLILLVL